MFSSSHRIAKLTIVWTAVLLAGCTSAPERPSYVDLTGVCQSGGSPISEDGEHFALSEDCVAMLGLGLGIDWDSFGETPHAISDPVTAAERVIAGFALLTDAAGPSSDLLLSEVAPEAVTTVLEPFLLDDGSSTGMGELMYSFYGRHIDSVQYWQTEDFRGRYDDGRILIGDIAENYQGLTTAVQAVDLLAHEVFHAVLPPHSLCADGYFRYWGDYCDADTNGAFAAGGWVMYVWFVAHFEYLESACLDAARTMIYICPQILDSEGFVPCNPSTLMWELCGGE